MFNQITYYQIFINVILGGSLFGFGATSFVDPGVVFVESYEGWGSSLAWWGDVLGGMPEDVQEEITNAIFSPDRLNLNILRYNIGGTTPGSEPCGPYRAGGAVESFLDGPNESYNWTRDPRQRKILLMAKALGVDIIEAFSNSPPQWMTISGCSKGNDDGGNLHKNFDPSNGNSAAFADYLTQVLQHYHQEYNVSFQYIAPFNEPSSGYWHGEGQNQEGCNMDLVGMDEVVKSLYDSINSKNMDYTSISVADETSIDVEINTQNYFRDQGLGGMIKKINSHGYGGSRRDLLYSVSQRDKHVLWMDEMGWGVGNNMEQGLNVGNRIVLDIRNMLPSAWVYWQVLEDRGAWGLIDIPYSDPKLENIRLNSGYWSMLQFSKYIRKGFTIVQVNNENTLAAIDRKNSKLILVVVNGESKEKVELLDLSLFSSLGEISGTRTSNSEQNVIIDPPTLINDFTIQIQLEPQSITTIVIENAVIGDSIGTNLIQNGDFEENSSGTPEFWTLYFGENGGANQDYTRRGDYSGFIRTGDSDLSLNQDIILPYTKTYFLSAWCASSGSSARIGIHLNDIQGPEQYINNSKGYEIYGLKFDGKAGDKLSVYLYADQDGSESFIDDVVLH